MNSIGNNIRNLRVSAGMSQGQLAQRLGKTRAAVSKYESGKIIPRMGVVESLSSIFHVPKSEIIGDTAQAASYPPDESSLTPDERWIVAQYRSLNPDGKDRLREQVEFLLERHGK